MMAKNSVTDEELLAQLGGLGASAATNPASSRANKSKAGNSTKPETSDDPLAALISLAKAKPISRPNTPKLAGNTRRNADPTYTPASTESPRTSDDRSRTGALARKSGESTTPLQHELTPTSEDEARDKQAETAQQQGGGGWWGGFFASASAAVNQAQNAVKEIQKNEEAQKWVTQVKGNVGAIRGLGGELTSRALPTFTDILNTIAPPISQHEKLQIHITHDLVGYPALDPSIYTIFSRVMSQVEGGDLLVIQRGSESRGQGASKAGWSDGPWWRDGQRKRDLGVISGLVEGTKLARANAESFANEYYAAKGGVDVAIKQANEGQSEANPVRTSDVFLAFQAVAVQDDDKLFQAPTDTEKQSDQVEDEVTDERICFAIYLHDPLHAITFKTVTQSFPRKWADWLDAEQDPESELNLPSEIHDIVAMGGIDPREWISEWVEEAIGLGVGIIAQRYVARRMGVGEAGLGKGKAAQPAVESGAGEAARAI